MRLRDLSNLSLIAGAIVDARDDDGKQYLKLYVALDFLIERRQKVHMLFQKEHSDLSQQMITLHEELGERCSVTINDNERCNLKQALIQLKAEYRRCVPQSEASSDSAES